LSVFYGNINGRENTEVLFMQIETKRLLIRNIKTDDAVSFAIMAAD
jgi:hypothetical protein